MMLRFLADENFNGAIVRGLIRRLPVLDIVTVKDAELAGMGDPDVLEWAAKNDRILLTHDISTIPEFVRIRIDAGRRMPGVVEVAARASIARVIEDVVLLAQCSLAGEWEKQIIHIPL